MTFTHRICSLDITEAALKGMSFSRELLWEKTLEDCKKAFASRNISRAAKKTASEAIDALQDKKTAKGCSVGALSTYRYFGEGQIRSLLSMAYEDLLPFEWSCNWSAAAMQEVMLRLNFLLSPLTTVHKSRILRLLPISVVSSMMDVIASAGAHDFSCWDDNENLELLIKKAKRMAKGFSKHELADKDVRQIENYVYLISDGFHHLRWFLNGRDFYFFGEEGEEGLNQFQVHVLEQYASADSNTHIHHGQVCREDALDLIRQLRELSELLATDYALLFYTQDILLHEQRGSHIPNVCRTEIQKRNGTTVQKHFYIVNHILMDMVYMYSCIANCMNNLSSPSNQESVGHMMTVLAEAWDRKQVVNHRKLFMLFVALMEGIDPQKVDNTLLVEGVMEKLDDEGHCTEGRKTRAQLHPRQTKRAPNRQPRVIYVGRHSDSDNDAPTKTKRKSVVSLPKDRHRSACIRSDEGGATAIPKRATGDGQELTGATADPDEAQDKVNESTSKSRSPTKNFSQDPPNEDNAKPVTKEVSHAKTKHQNSSQRKNADNVSAKRVVNASKVRQTNAKQTKTTTAPTTAPVTKPVSRAAQNKTSQVEELVQTKKTTSPSASKVLQDFGLDSSLEESPLKRQSQVKETGNRVKQVGVKRKAVGDAENPSRSDDDVQSPTKRPELPKTQAKSKKRRTRTRMLKKFQGIHVLLNDRERRHADEKCLLSCGTVETFLQRVEQVLEFRPTVSITLENTK